MGSIEKTYTIVSTIVFLIMVFIFVRRLASKNTSRFAYLLPIGMGMITIPVYSVFVFSKTYKMAMLFDALYFACTDWLCFSMLFFIVEYCAIKLESKSFWAIPITLCLADTVSLITNTWTRHSFNLHSEELANGSFYWGCEFTWIHYLHLGWCYLMIALAVIVMIYRLIQVPWAYKSNYLAIFLAFAAVIISNMICYSLDLAIDFSVLLYPLLAAFILYHSMYSVPHRLLSIALKYLNESFNDAMLLFDTEDECIYQNSMAKKLLSENGKFSEAKAVDILVKTRKMQAASSDIKPIEFFTIDNNERQFEAQTEDIYFGYNLIGSYLKLADNTEEIQKFLSQRYLATHDELTGVYNREYFFEVCDEKIKQNPITEYIMFSSNIIQFKLINELFGKETGDKVLIALANIAKKRIRDGIIGRINDDKFCCLVPKENFKESYLKDIKMAMQKVIEGSMHKINIRAGVCQLRGDTESARLVYDKTQLVINNLGDDYHKNAGWYDSDLMDKLLRERRIADEFESALESGRISMYLQPFVDGDKNVSGAEALARWNHSTYGAIMPGTFIPVLERSGLVHKLDTFIWQQAAKTLGEWQQKGIGNVQISVNVSSKDIFYIDIPKEFETLLAEYKFNPKNLEIEFTENTITGDTKKAAAVFRRLQDLGFEISIDDFGHGYSSLNMLKDVNADILKMDMVLIQRDENSERVKVILNFISQISRALGMRLISKGVETLEQLEMLKKLGCEYFQGFYFSHPLAIGDFENKYIARRNYAPHLPNERHLLDANRL